MLRKSMLGLEISVCIGECILWIMFVWIVVSSGLLGGKPSIPDEPDDQIIERVEFDDVEILRDSAWPRVRDEFVSLHPQCEACGAKKDLNVHHIKPYHLRPDLELESSNLITLCRNHHFSVGHDPDGPWGPKTPSWKLYNPKVREHCRKLMKGNR